MSKPINYDELDPGIRGTVRWLNEHYFPTTDSGDGVTKTDMECALAIPNVTIRCESPDMLINESRRLAMLLKATGICVEPVGTSKVYIQASYDPTNDVAIILLFGVDDATLGLEAR